MRLRIASIFRGQLPQVGDPPGKKYYEIPLAFQDRSFNSDGSIFFPSSRAFFRGLAAQCPLRAYQRHAPLLEPGVFWQCHGSKRQHVAHAFSGAAALPLSIPKRLQFTHVYPEHCRLGHTGQPYSRRSSSRFSGRRPVQYHRLRWRTACPGLRWLSISS